MQFFFLYYVQTIDGIVFYHKNIFWDTLASSDWMQSARLMPEHTLPQNSHFRKSIFVECTWLKQNIDGKRREIETKRLKATPSFYDMIDKNRFYVQFWAERKFWIQIKFAHLKIVYQNKVKQVNFYSHSERWFNLNLIKRCVVAMRENENGKQFDRTSPLKCSATDAYVRVCVTFHFRLQNICGACECK